MSIGIAHYKLLLLADSEVFEDMAACGDGVGGFRGDGAMVYLLHGGRVTI